MASRHCRRIASTTAAAPTTTHSTPLLPSQVTALTTATSVAFPAIRPLIPAAAPWSAASSGAHCRRTRTSRTAKISAAAVMAASGVRLLHRRSRTRDDMNPKLPTPQWFTPGTFTPAYASVVRAVGETIRGVRAGRCATVWERLERYEMKYLARRGGTTEPGQPPFPSQPVGTDLLPQIEHIVVLMMENHSYDNYFGMLRGRGEGFPLGADGEPVVSNPGTDGERVRAHHLPSTVQHVQVPSQSWHASHLQWRHGTCRGFVAGNQEAPPGADASVAMTYWEQQDLPFYYGLARTFPLATRWFSSCLGPTFPNRRFLIAGTAHGLIDDLPFAMVDYPAKGTIFDLLAAHGISWVNYHHLSPVRVRWRRLSHAWGLNYLRTLGALFVALFPQLIPALVSKVQATADLYPLGFLRSVNHLRPIAEFWQAARAGKLPAVSIIDPDFGSYSEENPQD